MKKMFSISMLTLAAVLLSACGSPSTPAASKDGAAPQQVNVAISTNPSPATVGDVELILTLTDGEGSPIEGAKVDVSADHTDMTGMGMSGLATDQGGGRYSIKANFEMSGNWKLTVYVRKEGLDDNEEFELEIQ